MEVVVYCGIGNGSLSWRATMVMEVSFCVVVVVMEFNLMVVENVSFWRRTHDTQAYNAIVVTSGRYLH